MLQILPPQDFPFPSFPRRLSAHVFFIWNWREGASNLPPLLCSRRTVKVLRVDCDSRLTPPWLEGMILPLSAIRRIIKTRRCSWTCHIHRRLWASQYLSVFPFESRLLCAVLKFVRKTCLAFFCSLPETSSRVLSCCVRGSIFYCKNRQREHIYVSSSAVINLLRYI